MKKRQEKSRLLQFRLSVKNIQPEIWRKVLVSPDVTLEGLHGIVQVLMGWSNRHLYAFVINSRRYTSPIEDDGEKKNDAVRTRLSSVLTKGTSAITYEYDFGDRWEIEINSETAANDVRQDRQVQCIEGSRHGPVEDSGGWRDYMEKVKIYGNPRHKRYLEVQRWIGPEFDAEAFDLQQTNEKLMEIT
jgi:hypothetical protein